MPARKKEQRELLEEKWASDVEKLDPTPIEATVPIHTHLTMQEELRRFVREQVSQAANEVGAETFEEANDFEEENPDLLDMTAYELDALQVDDTPPLDGVEAPQEADLPEGDEGNLPSDNQKPSNGSVEHSEGHPSEVPRDPPDRSGGPSGDN